MLIILVSSFACPGSASIWGGKKGEFRDWTYKCAAKDVNHERCRVVLKTGCALDGKICVSQRKIMNTFGRSSERPGKRHAHSRYSEDTLPSRRVYFESRTRHVFRLLSFFRPDHTLFKNRANELNGVMFVSFLSQLLQLQKWVLR